MGVALADGAAGAVWRRRLRAERISRRGLAAAAGVSLVLIVLVIAFLALRAWPAVIHIGLDHFFGSATWDPDGAYHTDALGEPQYFYGAWTPILGSITVVVLALIVAVPAGICLALVLTETNRRLGSRTLRPAVELFVGIPSIVYGYLGLVVLVPRLAPLAPAGRSGQGFLAAAIVLALMIVPTVATLSADAFSAVPLALREGSLGLGATQWQTIARVLVPAARSGIITGAVLGFARAMGEALAVAMVIGNAPVLPDMSHGPRFLMEPGMTMTTTITDGISNLGANPKAEAARYMLALVLLLFTFLCVTAVRYSQRRAEAHA